MPKGISRTGGDGDDTLQGTLLDDTLDGGFGADTLNGGAGNDTLYGGDGDDTLDGGTGNDVLFGGRGADVLKGGRGHDTLYGGLGADTFEFRTEDRIAFAEGFSTDTIADFEEGDTIHLIGLSGGFAALDIRQDGADTVIRYGGHDWIRLSGVSADSLDKDDFTFGPHAGSLPAHLVDRSWTPVTPPAESVPVVTRYGDDYGNHILVSFAPARLYGGGGNDRLESGGGNDKLYGGSGNDKILGEGGKDRLHGGGGNDKLYGGDGNDSLFGGKGDDWLFGGEGDDTLHGGKGDDALHGDEGDDTLHGGKGDDCLQGDLGNDTLYGGKGNDLFYGGRGDDQLHGGEGSDTFVFSGRNKSKFNGDDTIHDFEDGEDIMSFNRRMKFEDLTITQSGENTVITWNGASVTLIGIQASQITGDDFDFDTTGNDHYG